MRDEIEFLMNESEPCRFACLRRTLPELLTVDGDPSAIRRGDAREAADQSRLAGAVRADETVHLAAADIEVDITERDLSRKVLVDAANFHPWASTLPPDGGVLARCHQMGRLSLQDGPP